MSKYPQTILVVEDDDYLSKIIVNRLDEEGFVVQSANDGSSALVMTKAQDFSLILLDLLMPVMNGFDFLRKFNEAGGKTPVIVFSNLSQNQYNDEILKLGAESYFVKTEVSVDEIVKKIKKVFGI